MYKLIIVAVAGILINTCSEPKKNTETFWVNGEKVDCDGLANRPCLQISFADEPNDTWEYFYDTIEDFEFEEGVQKQITVEKTINKNLPADESSNQYKLVEVIQTQASQKTLLNNNWTLQSIQGQAAEEFEGKTPTFEVNVKENRFGGNAGCNQYFGSFKTLTESRLETEKVGATRMACGEENIENTFFPIIGNVRKYRIEESDLIFYNEQEEQIAAFKKGNSSQ